METDMKPHCKHCLRDTVGIYDRGLCNTCHSNKAIRNLYPCDPKWTKHKERPNETMAELEALIAEMLPTMPGGENQDDRRKRPRKSATEARMLSKRK